MRKISNYAAINSVGKMKTRFEMSFHGEPKKATRRKGLTEKISANEEARGNFKELTASANQMSNLILKIHQTHNLFLDFEEEEAMLKSMEAADGLVAAA